MHIHILGICGTFMGGLAILAEELGHTVSGSDANVYPPMSTQLEARGIKLHEGYRATCLQQLRPDLVIIGNAMSRGNEAIEYILNHNLPYVSGPEWLHDNVLCKRHVLAVSGTHGKTTTTGMLMWILHCAGKNPGFVCGGVPKNFNVSARLGASPFFVIEADEYDTAFFDKRSKFLHYCPRTLIVNNIEFDHADIFPDLAAIQRQFSHLLRLVPGAPEQGLVVCPCNDENVKEVLAQGCWSQRVSFGCESNSSGSNDGNNACCHADWRADSVRSSATETTFAVYHSDTYVGTVRWQLAGIHNVNNALAALAASAHIGIDTATAIEALGSFAGIKRRLEFVGEGRDGIAIYDDFAHHPTAITTTIDGLRARCEGERVEDRQKPGRIIIAIELVSNTMRAGKHGANLIQALNRADCVYILRPSTDWGVEKLINRYATVPMQVMATVDEVVAAVVAAAQPKDKILIMSNKSFGAIQQKILQKLLQSI